MSEHGLEVYSSSGRVSRAFPHTKLSSRALARHPLKPSHTPAAVKHSFWRASGLRHSSQLPTPLPRLESAPRLASLLRRAPTHKVMGKVALHPSSTEGKPDCLRW